LGIDNRYIVPLLKFQVSSPIHRITLTHILITIQNVANFTLCVLSQGLTKAVEALVGLLDNTDDRLKRLAAKDIIDFIIRHKENEDLDERLAEVEKRLAEERGG